MGIFFASAAFTLTLCGRELNKRGDFELSCSKNAVIYSDFARNRYANLIPNGNNVPGSSAVGHTNPSGGTVVNQFGNDFRLANYMWTKTLCLEVYMCVCVQLLQINILCANIVYHVLTIFPQDSDGDGISNGVELGDPCCQVLLLYNCIKF